jgi:AcrR family transcriptional regulator
MKKSAEKSYHHGSLKEAAIHEVLEFVVRAGHLDFSLREIAKACGVSAPAFYRHFESKEVLLIEVAKRGYELFHQKLQYAAELHSKLPSTERIQQLGMAYIDFAIKYEGHYRVMFNRELHVLPSYPSIKPLADQSFRLLRTTISEAFKGSGMDVDDKEAELATLQAWSMVHGLSHLWLSRILGYTETQFLKMSREIVKTKII